MLFCFLQSQLDAYSDTQTPHAHTVPEIKIEAILNVSRKAGEIAIHMLCFVLINSVLLNLLGYVFGSCFRTLTVSFVSVFFFFFFLGGGIARVHTPSSAVGP